MKEKPSNILSPCPAPAHRRSLESQRRCGPLGSLYQWIRQYKFFRIWTLVV